jgi:hypothetical protein
MTFTDAQIQRQEDFVNALKYTTHAAAYELNKVEYNYKQLLGKLNAERTTLEMMIRSKQ